jgi:hypothetical protein
MPPVVPVVTEKNEPKIDDNVKKTEGFGSVNNASYLPPMGNENMEREQEEEDEEKNPLDQTVFLDQSFLDELDKEIQDEKDLENDQNIEDEQDKDQAINEAATQVKSAVDQINEKITVLEETGKKSEADAARNAAEQLGRIQDSMNEVRGWNFAVVPIKKQEQGFLSKFWNRATGLFAKISKLAVNVATSPVAIYKYVSSNNALSRAREKMQKAKRYDTIPGWNGATFNRSENDSGEDMIYDERKVPIVWSYLTAGRAEVEEDGKKVPAPPEVTIYIRQPVPGTANSMYLNHMGHAMLGVSYTRYSRITGRNERYAIQFGFYPAGGVNLKSAGSMLTLDAIIPGQLQDDFGEHYSISKRYTVTMAQLGRILKASETYAQGGYSYYKRNCATFVKNMTMDYGQVAGVDESVFTETEIAFSAVGELARFGAGTIETYFNAGTKNRLSQLSELEDQSYQGLGNKRVTQQDVDRYIESSANPEFTKKAFVPGVIGEELRMNRGGRGVISSFEYTGGVDANEKDADSIRKIVDQLKKDNIKLSEAVDGILSGEERQKLPVDLSVFAGNLDSVGSFEVEQALRKMDKRYNEKKKRGPKLVYELMTADEILKCRISISEELDMLSDLYYTYLKGDKRINTVVMNSLSQVQRLINILDSVYSDNINSTYFTTDSDLGNVANRMFGNTIKIKTVVGDKTHVINLSPSMVEGYMQAYNNDMSAFLKDYISYNRIDDIPEGKRTDEQKRIYNRLKRMRFLASNFDSAHRYMLERKSYTQQDIDYVMSLVSSEKKSEAAESYTEGRSAGAIYQQLILERVFGGLVNTFKDVNTQENKTQGLPLEIYNELVNKTEKGLLGVIKWLDNYLVDRLQKNPDIISMILKSLYDETSKEYEGQLSEEDIKGIAARDFWKLIDMYVKATAKANSSDKVFGPVSSWINDIMNRYTVAKDIKIQAQIRSMI